MNKQKEKLLHMKILGVISACSNAHLSCDHWDYNRKYLEIWHITCSDKMPQDPGNALDHPRVTQPPCLLSHLWPQTLLPGTFYSWNHMSFQVLDCFCTLLDLWVMCVAVFALDTQWRGLEHSYSPLPFSKPMCAFQAGLDLLCSRE